MSSQKTTRFHSRRVSSSRFAFPLVVLPIAALLAGCAGGKKPQANTLIGDPKQVLSATMQKTQATSFRIDGKLEFSIDGAGKSMSGSAPISGVMDPAAKRQDVIIDMTPMMKTIMSGVNGTDELPAMFNDFKIEMRGIDDKVYVKSAAFSMLTGDKAPWVEMDPKELGVDTNQLWSGIGASDPTAGLSYLNSLDVDAPIETVGNEEIRGMAATHYRAEVDTAKVAAAFPNTKKQLDASALPAKFPIDVWINNDGRTVRTTTDFTMAQGGSGMKAKISVDYFDFGTKVDVQAPPASDVRSVDDIPALKDQLKSGESGGLLGNT